MTVSKELTAKLGRGSVFVLASLALIALNSLLPGGSLLLELGGIAVLVYGYWLWSQDTGLGRLWVWPVLAFLAALFLFPFAVGGVVGAGAGGGLGLGYLYVALYAGGVAALNYYPLWLVGKRLAFTELTWVYYALVTGAVLGALPFTSLLGKLVVLAAAAAGAYLLWQVYQEHLVARRAGEG